MTLPFFRNWFGGRVGCGGVLGACVWLQTTVAPWYRTSPWPSRPPSILILWLSAAAVRQITPHFIRTVQKLLQLFFAGCLLERLANGVLALRSLDWVYRARDDLRLLQLSGAGGGGGHFCRCPAPLDGRRSVGWIAVVIVLANCHAVTNTNPSCRGAKLTLGNTLFFQSTKFVKRNNLENPDFWDVCLWHISDE